MKSSIHSLLMAAALASTATPAPSALKKKSKGPKKVLTPKQKKVRQGNKAAKISRKQNRKK